MDKDLLQEYMRQRTLALHEERVRLHRELAYVEISLLNHNRRARNLERELRKTSRENRPRL